MSKVRETFKITISLKACMEKKKKKQEREFDLSQLSFMSPVVLQALPYRLAHFAGSSCPLQVYFSVKTYKITFISFQKCVC